MPVEQRADSAQRIGGERICGVRQSGAEMYRILPKRERASSREHGRAGESAFLPCSNSHFASRIQKESDWATVDQFDFHVLLEASRSDLQAMATQFGDEALIQLVCLFGTGSPDETGASSFGAISQQRELADDQDPAGDFLDGEIHLSLGIFEDPQPRGLFSEGDAVLLSIPFFNSQENQQSGPDLAGRFVRDRDFRPRYSLYNRSHVCRFLSL